MPVSLIVAYPLAVATDGDNAFECLDFIQGLLQLFCTLEGQFIESGILNDQRIESRGNGF
jgi:hypothetical protein